MSNDHSSETWELDVRKVGIAISTRKDSKYYQIATTTGLKEVLLYDKKLMISNCLLFKEWSHKIVTPSNSNSDLSRLDDDNEPLYLDKIDFNELKLMLHYLKDQHISLQNIHEALKAFNTARIFQCPRFYIKCIMAIDGLLNCDTVLDVYIELFYFRDKEFIQSYKRRDKKNFIVYFGSLLMENVLQFIDANAEHLLSSPKIIQLPYAEFKILMMRETLLIKSERRFIDCLLKWCEVECKRRNIAFQPINVHQILGPLLMVPHYLLMNGIDFEYAYKYLDLGQFPEMQILYNAFKFGFPEYVRQINPALRNMFTKFLIRRPTKVRRAHHLSHRSSACTIQSFFCGTEKIEQLLFDQYQEKVRINLLD